MLQKTVKLLSLLLLACEVLLPVFINLCSEWASNSHCLIFWFPIRCLMIFLWARLNHCATDQGHETCLLRSLHHDGTACRHTLQWVPHAYIYILAHQRMSGRTTIVKPSTSHVLGPTYHSLGSCTHQQNSGSITSLVACPSHLSTPRSPVALTKRPREQHLGWVIRLPTRPIGSPPLSHF